MLNSNRLYFVAWLLFGLSWLAFDHFSPWSSFESELLAFMGLAVLALGTLLYRAKPLSIPRIGIWLSAIIWLPWLQYATKQVPFVGDAVVSSLYLFGLLAAIVLGYCLCRLEGLMHSLWIAALVSAAIGLAQWLNVEVAVFGMYVVPSSLGARAMGNMGQANQLATLLLMGMGALVWVFERRTIHSVGFGLGIAFMSVVLVLTQSRSGMVGALLMAVYLGWMKPASFSRITRKAVLGWLLCFALATLLLPSVSDWLRQEGVRTLQDAAPIHERWTMWQQVGYAITQSPWVGFGWNQTAVAQTVGAMVYPGKLFTAYSHSVVLDVLAWCGIPLGLLLLGLTAWWLLTRMKASTGLDAVVGMACLLPFAVHSLLEFPFAYAYFLIVAGLLIGLVEAKVAPKPTTTVPTPWGWVMLLLLLPVGAWLVYEYVLIEDDFRVVRFENLRTGSTPPSYEVPHVQLLTQLGAMLQARRLEIKPNLSAVDLENLRVVTHRMPDNVLRYRYALALALNHQIAAARLQLDMIRSVFGEQYHAACLTELRRLQHEKYPELENLF